MIEITSKMNQDIKSLALKQNECTKSVFRLNMGSYYTIYDKLRKACGEQSIYVYEEFLEEYRKNLDAAFVDNYLYEKILDKTVKEFSKKSAWTFNNVTPYLTLNRFVVLKGDDVEEQFQRLTDDINMRPGVKIKHKDHKDDIIVVFLERHGL